MNFERIPSQILNDSDTSPTESTLIHSYPGSMPAYLASRLAERYSSVGEVVFDPFCGSVAVLLEAAKLGREVAGVDLLDISVELAQTAFELPNPERILKIWGDVRAGSTEKVSIFAESKLSLEGMSEFHVELSKWFHKETFVELMSVYREINDTQSGAEKRLFDLVLSSSLMSLSNRASRGVLHWGWIADNVKPKEFDLLRVNVFEELNKRILRLTDFMKAANSYKLLLASKSRIVNHNWNDSNPVDGFNCGEFDLLLTSPPYPYSIDYTLALRLTYYLFEKSFTELKKDEIGARFKRKRKDRGGQYLDELGGALKKSSCYIKVGGRAVFVLPHPDEYTSVVDLSIESWLGFIKEKMSGEWVVEEIGFRDCTQRRVVHASKPIRQELVAAFLRVKK
ncbi:MAG: DNA adenine methylase [Colwellia sp.]|nr:DNA adenine methylase [Colwellia sp.]